MGETPESHTKKVVQMHHLADNMAAKLPTTVQKANKQQLFGEVFHYTPICLGKVGDDFVTIEEYISGDFVKYINNTGELCTDEFEEFGQKAECLSHFSFEQLGKKLIVLDIQGSSASLYDPEIASVELKS